LLFRPGQGPSGRPGRRPGDPLRRLPRAVGPQFVGGRRPSTAV